MRITCECAPSSASTAIGFFVKTGARDETKELMGVSHFLEHMMFKGTQSRSAQEVDLAFDSLGAEHNAFTSGEMTAFWGACMPEVLGDVHDVLTDILRPSLRQEDFDAEKGVILEEIAMYDDQPFWVLYEKALETYFANQSVGHRVLGTNETIKAMQRDELAAYFEHRYSADNTIVALAGNVDFDDMVARIEQSCSKWTTTNAQRNYPQIQRATGELKVPIPSLNQQYIMMLMPSTPFDDERKYAATAVSSILGGGDGSRFHFALIDSGLAEQAATGIDTHDGYGEQIAWATCNPNNGEQVIDIMKKEMLSITNAVTQDDLDRVVAKAATESAIRSERPAGSMKRLGSMMTTNGSYLSLEDELEKIESLTLTDLHSVLEEFPWEPLFVAMTEHND